MSSNTTKEGKLSQDLKMVRKSVGMRRKSSYRTNVGPLGIDSINNGSSVSNGSGSGKKKKQSLKTIKEPKFQVYTQNILSDLTDLLSSQIGERDSRSNIKSLLEILIEETDNIALKVHNLSDESVRRILTRLGRLKPEIIVPELEFECNRKWNKSRIQTNNQIAPALMASARGNTAVNNGGNTHPRAAPSFCNTGARAAELEDLVRQLGYRDLKELMFYTKPSQIFGEAVDPSETQRLRRESRSIMIDSQLEKWAMDRSNQSSKGQKLLGLDNTVGDQDLTILGRAPTKAQSLLLTGNPAGMGLLPQPPNQLAEGDEDDCSSDPETYTDDRQKQ